MTMITNGRAPKASNQNEPDQLAVAGALPTTNDFRTLAKAFATVVVPRAIKDLKVTLLAGSSERLAGGNSRATQKWHRRRLLAIGLMRRLDYDLAGAGQKRRACLHNARMRHHAQSECRELPQYAGWSIRISLSAQRENVPF